MGAVQQMYEFVQLWDLIHQIHLFDLDDTITWRWMANRECTAKPTYLIMLKGSFLPFQCKMDLKGTCGRKAQILHQTLGTNKDLNIRQTGIEELAS